MSHWLERPAHEIPHLSVWLRLVDLFVIISWAVGWLRLTAKKVFLYCSPFSESRFYSWGPHHREACMVSPKEVQAPAVTRDSPNGYASMHTFSYPVPNALLLHCGMLHLSITISRTNSRLIPLLPTLILWIRRDARCSEFFDGWHRCRPRWRPL